MEISQLLNFGQSNSAYYIRCHTCREEYAEDPTAHHWREWEEQIRLAEIRLARRDAIQ